MPLPIRRSLTSSGRRSRCRAARSNPGSLSRDNAPRVDKPRDSRECSVKRGQGPAHRMSVLLIRGAVGLVRASLSSAGYSVQTLRASSVRPSSIPSIAHQDSPPQPVLRIVTSIAQHETGRAATRAAGRVGAFEFGRFWVASPRKSAGQRERLSSTLHFVVLPWPRAARLVWARRG